MDPLNVCAILSYTEIDTDEYYFNINTTVLQELYRETM